MLCVCACVFCCWWWWYGGGFWIAARVSLLDGNDERMGEVCEEMF